MLIILRHFIFRNCMLCWELNNVNLTWLQSKSLLPTRFSIESHFFSWSSQVSGAVSAPHFYISLVKRQSSAVSCNCISVPLPPLGLASCEKQECSSVHLQWACGTQTSMNTVIEYQVERDCKDHQVQPFLIKARSRHGLVCCLADP